MIHIALRLDSSMSSVVKMPAVLRCRDMLSMDGSLLIQKNIRRRNLLAPAAVRTTAEQIGSVPITSELQISLHFSLLRLHPLISSDLPTSFAVVL